METVDSTADPTRYPIPDSLRVRAEGLAKWMQVVGIIQTSVAGLGFALFSCSAIAVFSTGSGILIVTTALVLGMLAVLVRQGLLLQSAADHLKGLGEEPDDAHDHLQLAFARLRPMFVIDVVLGALLLLRNLLFAWGLA